VKLGQAPVELVGSGLDRRPPPQIQDLSRAELTAPGRCELGEQCLFAGSIASLHRLNSAINTSGTPVTSKTQPAAVTPGPSVPTPTERAVEQIEKHAVVQLVPRHRGIE
jgi:hypothetical protein